MRHPQRIARPITRSPIARYPITCSIALVLLAPWAVASADVVVIANRAGERIAFTLQPPGQPATQYALRPGDCISVPLLESASLRCAAGNVPRSYLVEAAHAYCFSTSNDAQDQASPVELHQIGLEEPSLPLPDQPAASDGDAPAAAPRDAQGIARIKVKLLVDDDQPASRRLWQPRLEKRLQAASLIFERHCRLGFEVVEAATWESDDGIDDFARSLFEFETKVRTQPARLAIGFTSQYQLPRGRTHLGGTRGPLATHILLREWSQHVTEAERLELLVHELGHFLGAAHSPEPTSVMRRVLSDRPPGTLGRRIVFDPLNTLAICLVSQELSERPIGRVDSIRSPRRERLASIYATLTRALPSDQAAEQLSGILVGNEPLADQEPADQQSATSGSGPPSTQRQSPAPQPVRTARSRRPAEGALPAPASPGKPAGATQARQLVVDAIAAAAQDNHGQPKPDRLAGDPLTEHYVRAAAAAAAALPAEEGKRAFLIGLAAALDRTGLVATYSSDWDFAGRIDPPGMRQRPIEHLGTPTLYDRHDLAAHFFVSAAMTVLAGPGWAESLGIGKELRDARSDSGFSFSDICADLAGIRFAQRVLDGQLPLGRLAEGFRVAEHLPRLDDLPDGLSEEEFREGYGSIVEPRFVQMLSKIRKRLDRLAPPGD